MTTPRMRPVFERPFTGTIEGFFGALESAVTAAGSECRATCFGHAGDRAAILRRQEADLHLWSPALHVYVEPADDGSAILHGRFSPSSPVWTAFVAIYLTLTIGLISAACYGGAQILLDETPWAFVGVPVALALAGFTYGAAFIGQGLGSADMYELRTFVERVADDAGGATPVERPGD
ncbi:MAG: hypothetical protein NXI31_02565 [bacterium]|nr:hypothetical protein [bacterium]